jgi:hypothetical protein
VNRSTTVALAALALLAAAIPAAALDVPLTVEERFGARRALQPAAGGIPLPRGLMKDVSALRVVDEAGKEVPAQFTVLGKWWPDESVKWVLVEFQADLAPGSVRTWRLKDGGKGTA